MTVDALITLGLPGGRWPALAQALLQGTPHGLPLGHPDADGADPADPPAAARITAALANAPQGGLCTVPALAAAVVAQPPAGSAVLALVEHPVAALAAALDADPQLDTPAWLAAWQHAGQQLLRLAQRHRARCLLVDADEAARQPQLLCDRLASLVPAAQDMAASRPLSAQQMPGQPPADPLVLALADALCAQTPGLTRLQRELLAACEPLSAAEMALPATPLADARAAWQSLAAQRLAARKTQAALQAALARQEVLLQQRATLRSELSDTRASGVQAQRDRQAADKRANQLSRELTRLEGQAAQAIATTAEAESRAAQATTAAQQSEAAAARWREQTAEAEAALGQAQQQHAEQLAQWQAQQHGLHAQLQAQASQLQAQQQALLARQAEDQALQQRLLGEQAQAHQRAMDALLQGNAEALRQAGAQAARSGADADLAKAEADLLMRQLHEAQEALEQTELAIRKLRTAQAALPPPVPGELSIGEARSADANDERPYRGLSFMLRRVRAGSRPLADTQVRLVEHHGHPGLAVFQHSGAEAPLLRGWRDSGREGDRAYLLLVPTDAHCVPALQALDSSDWQTLLAVVARLVQELRRAPPAQRQAWLPLACRLGEQLQELPAQLRHAGVSSTAADGGPDLLLHIHQLSWGVRRLDGLHLRWQLHGSQRGLALLRAADDSVPLLSWPEDEQGDSPQMFWLPLAAHHNEVELAHWARLPLADRVFVQALLDALPTLVAALPSAEGGSDLVAAAQALQAEARQTLFAAPAPPSSVLRRVIRRLRRRGTTA